MKKPHLAFIELPHYSNVNPSLALVSVLIRRGHHITYVASKAFQTVLEALGAEVVLCPAWPVEEPGDTKGGMNEERSKGHSLLRMAELTLASISSYYERNTPDLILYDTAAIAGRVLAHQLGVPAIHVSPYFSFDQETFDRFLSNSEFLKANLPGSKMIDEFLATYGIVGSCLYHREDLNIFWYSEVFHPAYPEAFEGRIHHSGRSCFYAARCPAERPCDGPWSTRFVGDKPVALVSSSTSYVQGADYFKKCADAFDGLGWRVILNVPNHRDAELLKRAANTCEVVNRKCNLSLLPIADLHVCFGGTVTTSESAYHGVPMLVTSCGNPELEWQGDNLVRVGMAKHIKRQEFRVEAMRETIVQISEDLTMRDSVERLSSIVRRGSGGEETANRVEEFLSYRR